MVALVSGIYEQFARRGRPSTFLRILNASAYYLWAALDLGHRWLQVIIMYAWPTRRRGSYGDRRHQLIVLEGTVIIEMRRRRTWRASSRLLPGRLITFRAIARRLLSTSSRRY